MTIYYKATQPDGTDFRTGTVHYQVGETLPTLPTVDDPQCCSGDVYHVSTSKADTLIGGTWPCRLFEVEAEAVAEEENKRGVYTMTVLRELPAWEALGPNGREVVNLLRQAESLTAERIDAIWTALDAAWDAARRSARTAAWGAARDAARGAARGAAWAAAWGAAWAAARGAARGAAWDAAGDAAGALVVRDLISAEHFNTLHGPWASATR